MTIADPGAVRPASLDSTQSPPVATAVGAPIDRDWVSDLSGTGIEQDAAVRELHALVLRATRHQVWHLRAELPRIGPAVLEDIARFAADDAVVLILARLHTFEGRSRFTTWAYKFGILQAANEVRRHAWANREIPIADDLTWSATAPGPELEVEAADLAAAVTTALTAALTAYQRRIAVALLVDQVPIDVLAQRLGTSRGALYKTLHVARSRLRAHLVGTGHLAEAMPTAATSPSEESP